MANPRLHAVARWSVQAASTTEKRNLAILQAHDSGLSLRAIAAAATLSVEGVRRIIARYATDNPTEP